MGQASASRTFRNLRPQRGALLLYLVAALVLFSLLAGIMVSNYSLSTRGASAPDCQRAARLMAESGVRYAMSQLRLAGTQVQFDARLAAMNGQTFWMADSSSFTLTVGPGGGGYTVTSVGRSPCAEGEPVTATLTQNFTVDPLSGIISFANGDLSGFVAEGSFTANPTITVDNTAGTVIMGGNVGANSGAIWYAGTKAGCAAGNCTLGNGVRAYFEFVFDTDANADGFVFALISAETNNRGAGGDPTMGELLGYGGLGVSGKGLQAPKIGLEFDIYANACGSSTCTAGSRCDRNGNINSSQGDHIAFVYWGSNSNSGGCDRTYDDNRHGAGTLGSYTEPMNPDNPDGSGNGDDGYYYLTGDSQGNNWLQNGGTYRLRYELTRQTAPAANGQYCYELRAWVRKASGSVPAGMDDVSADYEAPPDVQHVFSLSPALHQQFNKFFFGWTEGTGAEKQIVTLSKFALDFKPVQPTPNVPSGYVGWWSMYEGSGSTVHDRSANRYDGTSSAGSNTRWVPGVGCPDCPALRLYGGGQNVLVPDRSALDLPGAGSLAAWVYLPAAAQSGQLNILRKGSTGSGSDEAYALYLDNGRPAIRVRRNSSTTATALSPTALAAGRWYHLVGCWNTNALAIYVDGVSKAATTKFTQSLRSTNAGLYFGTGYTGSFNGVLDEVLVYNRFLTPAEITQLYQSARWGNR